MAGKTPAASLSLKLLVDTKAQRVLYAEGSKDVVDFVLSLLAVPLGGVTNCKLLTAGGMVSSVGNLYGSVDRLGNGYACRGDVKAALLASTVLRLGSPDAASSSTANNGGSKIVTKVNGTACPVCRSKMTTLVRRAKIVTALASDEPSCKGHAPAGMVTYTVMDDLTVTPSSTVSAVTALVALGITDIRGLEKTVKVGYEEGLVVLKATLQFKTVLTDVFLGARPTAHRRPMLV